MGLDGGGGGGVREGKGKRGGDFKMAPFFLINIQMEFCS